LPAIRPGGPQRKNDRKENDRNKMTRIQCKAMLLVLLSGVTLAGVMPVGSALQTEYKIKVGLIYNFLKFTEWPSEQTRDSEVLTFGIAAEEDVYGILKFLHGKPAQNKTIKILRIDKKDLDKKEPEFAKKIDILFLSRTQQRKMDTGRLLKLIKGRSVLIIGETEGFLQKGGIINFLKVDNHVSFEINLDAAKESNLQIKTTVLKLATKVIQKK
jgi:hypothetical protein